MIVLVLSLLCAWTESFETQNYFPPNDWIIVNEDALDAVWYRDSTEGYTGTHCATIYGDTLYSDLSFTNQDYLITPQVLSQGSDTLVSFWYRASSSAGCSLDVLVSTSSPPAMPSFSLQQTYYVTNTSWIQQAISLSSYTGIPLYVAFRIRRVPTQQQFYLDDITLPQTTSQPHICNGRLRTKGSLSQKYLQIWGSHYEMGYAHGFLLAEEVMAQATRCMIGNTGQHLFTPAEWENVILPYWSSQFSVPSKYQQEVQGLYDGLIAKGVSLTHPGLAREITVQDILCSNAMFDFWMFACSSVSGWGQSTVNDDTLQGGLVMCRDMDFFTGRCMSATNTSFIVACSPSASNEQEFISIGCAGWIGVGSGVNLEGVGLCLNMGNHRDTNYIPPRSLVPIGLSTRNAIEIIDPDSSGVHDIFDITYSLDYETSLFSWEMHLFSPYDGTHPTPAGILELNNIGDSLRLVGDNTIYPQINSNFNLAVTNHHRVLYPPVSCSRYEEMADSLNADFHLTTQRAIDIEDAVSMEYSPSSHCTAQQMVFRPNIMIDHSDWPCIGVSYACRMVAAHHFPKIWYSWDELFEGNPGDVLPPLAPYIAPVEKSGNDLVLTWNKITNDTLGNPEVMDHYVVYRNTSPSFIPGASDSIGFVSHPGTTFTDTDVLDSTESYYYLVKAVDWADNRSKKSNMGFVFHKFINENAGTTSDRNWVSLPYISEYDSIKDLTDDLSPAGNPISKITRLDVGTQNYYSWIYHLVLGWYGNDPTHANFPIKGGVAYEMIAVNDDTVIFAGVNDPDGVVNLNENPGGTSDRNWVSITYNAVYDSVKDITDELSPGGQPVSKITRLDEPTQNYYSWIYHSVIGWYGNDPVHQNFPIEQGDGYEFIATKDTTWNPTEYSNEAASAMMVRRRATKTDIHLHIGKSLEPERAPAWLIEENVYKPTTARVEKSSKYQDRKVNRLVSNRETREIDYAEMTQPKPASKKYQQKAFAEENDYYEYGISHILHVDLELKGFENLIFTAYRPDKPDDVLTENSVGCVVAQQRGAYRLISFDVGNFQQPWHHGEEVVLIIEALEQGKAFFAVVNFALNNQLDIQSVDASRILLSPIPKPVTQRGLARWSRIDNDNIVGYSLYKGDKRLNEHVIKRCDYALAEDVDLRPVIKGGYETVYGSRQHSLSVTEDVHIPIAYSFNVFPNPFAKETSVDYAVPHQTSIEIVIYDVSGRHVRTLADEVIKPGYYSQLWNSTDDQERTVSSGVYFIRFETKDYTETKKLLLVR